MANPEQRTPSKNILFSLSKYHDDLLWENVGERGKAKWLREKIEEEFDRTGNLKKQLEEIEEQIEIKKKEEKETKNALKKLKNRRETVQKQAEIEQKQAKKALFLHEKYPEKEINWLKEKAKEPNFNLVRSVLEFKSIFGKRILSAELSSVIKDLKV